MTRRTPLPVSFPSGSIRVRASATQTPAFRRWFGGSVVVGKNGDPRVMFHGTDAGGPFTVFEPGKGRKTIAAFFSETEDHAHIYGRNIYPVYLSVKRPFDYRKGKKEVEREVENFYRTRGGIKEPWVVNALLRRYDTTLSDSEYEQADDDALPSSRLRAAPVVSALLAGDWRTFEDEDFVEYLRHRGYDALVMTELGNVNYAIFDPRQVKSASGNVGTFDPNDPDIRHNPKQRTRTTVARRLEQNPRRRNPSMTREERGALVALLAQEVVQYRDALEVQEERQNGAGAEETYGYAPDEFYFWDEDALERRLGVPLLGYGVSRIAVRLSDGTVAKLPWLVGLTGNDIEHALWKTSGSRIKELLLPVLDYFPDSDVLIVPYAEVLNDENPEHVRIADRLAARLEELGSSIVDVTPENCGFYTDPATEKKRVVVIDYAADASAYEEALAAAYEE